MERIWGKNYEFETMYIGIKPIPRKFSQSDIRSSYPPWRFWESCFPHKVSSYVEPKDITFCFFLFWLPPVGSRLGSQAWENWK